MWLFIHETDLKVYELSWVIISETNHWSWLFYLYNFEPFSNTSKYLSLCTHFQQQAFNAATAIHQMKKLHLSQSEPSALSMPQIITQSSSQNYLQALGPCHNEVDALDPNGNPVQAGRILSCSNPDTATNLCPPLRPNHSEPGNALTADETRDISKFHSEIEAPFRPSKRWEFHPIHNWKYCSNVVHWQSHF